MKKLFLLAVCLIPIDENNYINSDQIEIIRPATKTESHGRKFPTTTIIFQNDLRIFVHGTPEEIVNTINKERSKECKK